jgi:diguanylate cyclase (GGDEF)-like protein
LTRFVSVFYFESLTRYIRASYHSTNEPIKLMFEETSTLLKGLARVLGKGDASLECLALLLEKVPQLVSLVCADGGVIFASRYYHLLQSVSSEASNFAIETDLYPSNVHQQLNELKQHDATLRTQEWTLNTKHKDGTTQVYEMTRRRVEGVDGRVLVFSLGVNVTDHGLAETYLAENLSALKYLSFRDPLTGLANRSLLYDRLNKTLSRAKRSSIRFALMLIDIDQFRLVNENYGHDIGDRFLKKFAQNLQDELRDTDTIARIGGDEFVVVLDDIGKAHDIELIATKILNAASHPISFEDCEVTCTASMGISLFPKDGDNSDQLLRYADLAMYKAKIAGNNRHQFFVKAMTDTAVNYLLLENDLRKAIENGDMKLFFQPQIDLSRNTVVGLEALVRWQHKDRGLVPPTHFVALAEDTGLIEPLGDWVLERACQVFQNWLAQGFNFGRIAVNISARQFHKENFQQSVVDVLRRTGLSADFLELELTESSAMENAIETIDLLNNLKKMGLSISIDDFGTGYSSLAYLKRFPIQKLKVDKSFIVDIDTNPHDAAIAKSIIDLAHNMALEVIAEGVEREAQAAWLKGRGCDQVQGYYYSKPLSEDALLAWVKNPALVTINSNRTMRLLKP